MAKKHHRKRKPELSPRQQSNHLEMQKKVQRSKEKFLEAFFETDGNISLAAEEAGINRCTHYEWMEKDPEYAIKFNVFVEAIEKKEKELFLQAYRQNENPSVSAAAKKIGISRDKHFRWLRDDPEYAERFKDANGQLGNLLEAEAWRRGYDGVDEPVFYKGKIVGYIRKYSDGLLGKLMEAFMPEKYGKKDLVINNNNNLNVPLDEALAAARERLRNAQIEQETGTDNTSGNGVTE